MGFGFVFGKKARTVKFIRTYIKQRVKEKTAVREQLERLDAQRKNKTIDQFSYERMSAMLQISFIKQRKEKLDKARISGKYNFV